MFTWASPAIQPSLWKEEVVITSCNGQLEVELRYSVVNQGKSSRGTCPIRLVWHVFPKWLQSGRGWSSSTLWRVEGSEFSKTSSTEILLNFSQMLSLHKNLLIPQRETLNAEMLSSNAMFKLKVFVQSFYGTRLQNTWASLSGIKKKKKDRSCYCWAEWK